MRLTRMVKRGDANTGFEGFHIIGRDWQDPAGGMGIAHDLLEHFPGDKGTMEEEMMALGASLLVRGDAYFHEVNPYNPEWSVNFASDFPNFCRYMDQDGRSGDRLKYPGITRYLDIEDQLEDTKHEVYELLTFEGIRIPPWLKNWSDVKGWMRRGYRRAQRRYYPMMRRGGVPFQFFIDVEKKIDWALHIVEMGDHITVAIDIACYQCEVRMPEYLQ